MTKKVRNPSIELLRIVAMLCIIASHYACHGQQSAREILATDFVGGVELELFTLGNLGVDIFMAIAGYFGIDSKQKYRRLVPLVMQVFFYSVIMYVIFIANHLIDFEVKGAIRALFPISFDEYGFPTLYILVLILSPLLNVGIKEIKNNKKFLFLITFLWIFLPILSLNTVTYYCGELEQYIIAYSMGALVKLNEDKSANTKKNNTSVKYLILSIIGLIALTLVLSFVGMNNSLIYSFLIYLYYRNSPLMLLITFWAIKVFKDLQMDGNTKIGKIINYIAGTTFGIYLIHDNNYVRGWIWRVPFNNSAFHGFMLLVHLLMSVVVVFSLCSFIELIRKNSIEKLYIKGGNRIAESVAKRFEELSA